MSLIREQNRVHLAHLLNDDNDVHDDVYDYDDGGTSGRNMR